MEGTGSNDVDSPHSTVVVRPKHGNVKISGLTSYKVLEIGKRHMNQCSSILKLDQHFFLC